MARSSSFRNPTNVAEAEENVRAQHRSDRRSHRAETGNPLAPRRLDRDGDEALAGTGDRRRRQTAASGRDQLFSEKFACPEHPHVSLPELEPRLFSFNSPHGACPTCHGLGTINEFDPELIVPDESLSLENGAIEAWRKNGKRMNIYYSRVLRQFCKDFGVSYTQPYKDIPKKSQRRPDVRHGRRKATTARARGSRASSPTSNAASRTPKANGSKRRLHQYMSRPTVQDLRRHAAAEGSAGGATAHGNGTKVGRRLWHRRLPTRMMDDATRGTSPRHKEKSNGTVAAMPKLPGYSIDDVATHDRRGRQNSSSRTCS